MGNQNKRWNEALEHGPGHHLKWLFWAIPTFFFFFEFFIRVAPGVINQDLQKEFDITPGDVGWMLAIYYYAYAPLQLFVGVMIDRFGPRGFLAGASLFCGIGLVVFGIASTLFMLSMGRALMGGGSAFAYVGAVCVASMWFRPHHLGYIIGLTAMVGVSGAIVAQYALPGLFGLFSWQIIMFALALIAVITAVLLWYFVPDRPHFLLEQQAHSEKPTHFLSGLKTVLRNPQTWLLSITNALVYLPLATIGATWGVRELTTVMDQPSTVIGPVIATLYVGFCLGCPLLGYLSDRMHNRKIFIVLGAFLSTILAFIYPFLGPGSYPFLFAYFLVWGIVISTFVISFTSCLELNERHMGGSAVAFVNFVAMIVAACFIWCFGIIVDWEAMREHQSLNELPADFRFGLIVMAFVMLPAPILSLFIRESHAHRVCKVAAT
ncbi:MAG: MFS transporter [Phycisphaerales bacterium]|nr:MFS transporter [Phycisphaerales bacterium]